MDFIRGLTITVLPIVSAVLLGMWAQWSVFAIVMCFLGFTALAVVTWAVGASLRKGL